MPKVQYRDPVTGNVYWVEQDQLIGQNDHSLKGIPKGPMPEETKKKLSKAVKKHLKENPREQSDETKDLIRQANTGKTLEEATRQKISERATEQWARQKADGYTVSDKTKKKLSKAAKGKAKSPEHRAKIAAAMRARKNQS